MSALDKAWAYVKYISNAKNAHALHSPFLYNLYTRVIRESSGFRIGRIEELRRKLAHDHRLIDVIDFKNRRSERKTVSSVARTSTSAPKFSAFLHLLAQHLDAKTILETGTSLGINTSYLASSQSKVVTIEGSSIIAGLATRHFEELGLENITLVNEKLDDAFAPSLINYQPDFIFLDADHRGQVAEKQLHQIKEMIPAPKCIVLHDIYWSRDMSEFWKKVIADPDYSLTVDIFQAGLVFPGLQMPKQHFTLRF